MTTKTMHTPTPGEAMVLPWKCETELEREDYRVRNRNGLTVAHCFYKEHAALIVRAVNCHAELLEIAKVLCDMAKKGMHPSFERLEDYRRVITKAEAI